MDIIDARLKDIDGCRVLDLATGSGAFAARLAGSLASYEELVAVDSAPRALEIARKNLAATRSARVEEADAAALPYSDASFGLVAVSNSLHHFPDPARVLSEALRVLAPGGRLVVLEMHRDSGEGPALTHVLMHHWWAEVDSAGGVHHAETFGREALRGLVEAAAGASGFAEASWDEVVEEEGDPLDPGLLAEIEKIVETYSGKIEALGEGEGGPRATAEARAAMKARGLELLARARSVGFRSAPSLLFVGRKA